MNKFKKMTRMMIMTLTVLVLTMSVSANEILDSKPVKGTLDLISDATTVLTIICPLTAGLVALIFAIRRQVADEQDGKLWTKRITTAVIWGIGGTLLSGAIAVISTYYS